MVAWEPAPQGGTAPVPGKGCKTLQKFLRRLKPPKLLRNALTSSPAGVWGCLRRQLGPVTAAGDRDTLPGARGGDRGPLGDCEAVAYRLLAVLRGTDGVNPLEAKRGGLVGGPLVLCMLTRACALAQACVQPALLLR